MMAGRRARPGERATEGAARHIPVLLDEVLAALKPRDGEVFIDGTFGAGGYTAAILDAAAEARVVAIDQDEIGLARERVCYVEGHGSGNDSDVVELLALQECFASVRDRHVVRVGSVKSNIGFGEGSGGLAQLTKCALSLERGVVPAAGDILAALAAEGE